MDTETLNEFGHIFITAIVSVIVVAILTSSLFINRTKELMGKTVSAHEQIDYTNNEAYSDYIIEKRESEAETQMETEQE